MSDHLCLPYPSHLSTMPPPEYESESDLTELASDDDSSDDEVPLSKINARRPPTPSTTPVPVANATPIVNTRPSTRNATARSQNKEREVRGARLSPPNNTQRSTHWLHRACSFHRLCSYTYFHPDQLTQNWIDIDPEYQRGYFPPFHFLCRFDLCSPL